jgi:hypothetical protein
MIVTDGSGASLGVRVGKTATGLNAGAVVDGDGGPCGFDVEVRRLLRNVSTQMAITVNPDANTQPALFIPVFGTVGIWWLSLGER